MVHIKLHDFLKSWQASEPVMGILAVFFIGFFAKYSGLRHYISHKRLYLVHKAPTLLLLYFLLHFYNYSMQHIIFFQYFLVEKDALINKHYYMAELIASH